ncbi:hypothetical protein R1sor_026061 [Riccia sorocarpa]|uniref:Uncharacterized protein n=1 Tax=Riccia sorocarpa TaxID=122646 RepID=A0ABD3GAD3_9MARC
MAEEDANGLTMKDRMEIRNCDEICMWLDNVLSAMYEADRELAAGFKADNIMAMRQAIRRASPDTPRVEGLACGQGIVGPHVPPKRPVEQTNIILHDVLYCMSRTMRDLQKPARRCVPRWTDGAGEISRSQLGDASPGGLMAQARSPDDSSEMRPQVADGAGDGSGISARRRLTTLTGRTDKTKRRIQDTPPFLMSRYAADSERTRSGQCGEVGVLVVLVALAAVPGRFGRQSEYLEARRGKRQPIEDLHLMARTKQTARKYPAGKPPDPRRGQQYKLTQPIVKKRRRMSDEDRPRIEKSEEEEQEEEQEDEQQEEQEEGAEEEAEGEDDEDEIGTLELFRMIRASETRDHNGPWCTEMAKIPYAHISNANFREKEDLCFHIQV